MSSVAEAKWPDPPSPTGVNFLLCFNCHKGKGKLKLYYEQTAITKETRGALLIDNILGPIFKILDSPYIGSLFMSTWGFVYSSSQERYTLCSNCSAQLCSNCSAQLCSNCSAQLCSALAGGTKSDPAQSILVSFMCKHRDLIRNTPKACERYNFCNKLQIQFWHKTIRHEK